MQPRSSPELQPGRNPTTTAAVLTQRRMRHTLAVGEIRARTPRRNEVHVVSSNIIDFSAYSVRDGRLAPVTCVTCGCRLERHGDGTWWHFDGSGHRDARGCLIDCAERPHYAPEGIAAATG